MAADMLSGVATGMFSGIPLLIGVIVLVFVGFVGYLWMKRIGPWYWRGSLYAPCVFSIEGERHVFVNGGDRIRMTTEGKGPDTTMYWESKTYKDKFPASHLRDLIYYRKKGRGEVGEILPVVRQGEGVWARFLFTNEAAAAIATEDVRKSKIAIAIMRKGNFEHLGEDFISKYGAVLAAVFLGVVFLIGLIVTLQQVASVVSTNVAALNANSEAMMRIANSTCSHGTLTALPTPVPPPG